MKAVILAGGKGRRLAPYTAVFPKPMMPVGGMPILEILIRQLKARGVKEIVMAVGHFSSLLRAYFSNGKAWGVSIRYSEEKRPLGTAGPLSLVGPMRETFLVMNGDVLSTMSFTKLLAFHRKQGCLATVAVSQRVQKIDYGVIHLDGHHIREYVEKPSLDYNVSMGVYVFEPGVLKWIPRGAHLDFPDLINKLLKNGQKVAAYVNRDYWLDIGRPDDFSRAQEEFETIRRRLF